ncbi:MAG: hypothetical protein ABJI69_00930 [Balneola sp.]
MKSTIKDLINKDISYFKINPVVHLKSFIAKEEATEILTQLNQLKYEENIHEGEVVRYEVSIKEEKFVFIKQIKEILEEFLQKLGFREGYGFEFFVFKYEEGHFVPPHQDKERHKILFMIYIGEFEGGDYIYKIEEDVRHVELNNGDAVLSINELGPGNRQNPIHSVEKITRGVRYTIAGSFVSKNATI